MKIIVFLLLLHDGAIINVTLSNQATWHKNTFKQTDREGRQNKSVAKENVTKPTYYNCVAYSVDH